MKKKCSEKKYVCTKNNSHESDSLLHFKREIPIKYNIDVFVAGGGPAGIAAAVTAARFGAKVYLAEAHSCLGGMGTAGLVTGFAPFSDGINFLAGGIGEEVYNSLNTTKFDPEKLKRIYDDMLVKSDVIFTFYTQLISVEKEANSVSYAICSAKSGIFAVKAKIFIDCTGDGDLCAMAGADFEKGDIDGTMMPGTLCSLWCNINWENRSPEHRIALEKAFEDRIFTIPDRHMPGMVSVGNGVASANVGHLFKLDGTDEKSITQALVYGRRLILEYERYYKEYLKGYEKMTQVGTASLVGVRETRRIIGDYVLNLNDYYKKASFDDEIGRHAFPVDIHPSKTDKETYDKFLEEFTTLRCKKGESYGIPYRTLVPRKLKNVLVAGRCISSDRFVQSSIRTMPGCFVTGQATGAAAFLAISNNTDTRGIEIKELQYLLKKMGAYLPNFQK